MSIASKVSLEDRLLLALEFVSEGSQAAVPQRLSDKTFRTESFGLATEKLQKKSRPWIQGHGIQGIGIGEKVVEGKPSSELALRVYVNKKQPKSKVGNCVPKQVNIPEVGKCHTDVLEIGRVTHESFTSRVRPVMPGAGVGHFNISVGTLGCLVKKKRRGRGVYILSNSHVLADEGVGQVGDEILQPGKYDGGNIQSDVIGVLEDWVPFTFSGIGFTNLVDCAIAKVRKQSVYENIRILGVKPVGVSRIVRRGMRVQKVGRTTDYTTGVVTDMNYRFALRYKRPEGGTGRVGFRDQVLCTRYTAGGDSGSAVLNERERIVGLHFTGSPWTSNLNRISNVYKQLDIKQK